MNVKITASKALGTVLAPPSKSMAHRLLICAALGGGSVISNVAFSKDIEATLNCLKALGADIEINGDKINIGGIDINREIGDALLPCNESGSTLRFMIPICLLFGKRIKLTGATRLFERSLSVYEKIAEEQSFEFVKETNSLTVCGKLSSGAYNVRGDISSQFISGLMFALPLCEGDSVINIEGPIESGSYLKITLKALQSFGIDIAFKDEKTIVIKGSQKYTACNLSVEGDYSNAAFLDAFNVLGGKVSVGGLDIESQQGDRVYKELFTKLQSEASRIDISDCPDLAPILIAVAATQNGATFTGTRRLKIKESDRGQAMKAELKKMGCDITVEENRITVPKAELKAPSEPIFAHNDHRIVMSMAVLLTQTGGIISGAEAVTKSFPDFFNVLNSLGIKTEE